LNRIAGGEKPVSTFSRNAPFDAALLVAKSRYPPFRAMLGLMPHC
jgi:hypothetical protein